MDLQDIVGDCTSFDNCMVFAVTKIFISSNAFNLNLVSYFSLQSFLENLFHSSINVMNSLNFFFFFNLGVS